jgi:hypothetical protein
VSPTGNTLVYPKSDGDIKSNQNNFPSDLPRAKNLNQGAFTPPKADNLFAVISNINKDIADQEITDETGYPSKWLISAATDTPTKSAKITLPDAPTTQKFIKEGISVIFTKHKMVDY